MKVSFGPVKIEGLVEYIKSLPRGVKITAMRAFVTYIIGNKQHGLKHEPPYKYVKPFRSWSSNDEKAARQRRWIFAHLDLIGQDNRTHAISNGWTMKEKDSSWTHVSAGNQAPGVGWVMGDTQSRHSAAAGWRDYMKIIASNMAGAFRAANAAVNDYLKGRA